MLHFNNTPKIDYKNYLKTGILEIIDILNTNKIKDINQENIPDEIALTFDNLYIVTKSNLYKSPQVKSEVWHLLEDIDLLLKNMSDKTHPHFANFWNYQTYLSILEWQNIKKNLKIIKKLLI